MFSSPPTARTNTSSRRPSPPPSRWTIRPHKLNVWLLDDGGTDQKCNDHESPKKRRRRAQRRLSLQKLCVELGANYLTRARNEHAKAGNMNNALAHIQRRDHRRVRRRPCAVPRVPARNHRLFRPGSETVPGADAARLPQSRSDREEPAHFRPHAVGERNVLFGRRSAASTSGTARSSAVRRRCCAAPRSRTTGGFSGVTITEDCETAFELHAKGWTSVFVDKPLIAGLQPETFVSFIGQRSRWCQGMIQIMLLKNPLFDTGLKPMQRLAYLSSMTFWLFPFPRLDLHAGAAALHLLRHQDFRRQRRGGASPTPPSTSSPT